MENKHIKTILKRLPVCVALFILLLASEFTSGQTVHAVFFGATADDNPIVNKGLNKSLQDMETEVNNISKFTGYTLKTYYFTGQDVTKQNLVSTVSGLSCNSDDIIIFYYAGHGFNDETLNSRWPSFPMLYGTIYTDVLASNKVSLEWVTEQMKTKGARLTIILSESCNKLSDETAALSSTEKGTVALEMDSRIPERYKELYLNSKGVIVVAACDKGERAWLNENGGFFTRSFIEVNKEMTGLCNVADWNTIFDKVKKRAKTISEINEHNNQNVIYDINITSSTKVNITWDNVISGSSGVFNSQPDGFNSGMNYSQNKFIIARIVFYNNNRIFFLLNDNYIIEPRPYSLPTIRGYRAYSQSPNLFQWDIVNPINMGKPNIWGVDIFGKMWELSPAGQWINVGIVYY